MTITLWVILFLLATLILFLYGFWSIIPVLAGLPWRPTETGRTRKAFELAKVQPGEVVYDLGCGDGRVLVMAVRDFQAEAVGVEISLLHCWLSRFNARANKVRDHVSIRQGDFYSADLHDADVVFAYMTSRQVGRLKPHLERQLRPDARVVTISFDMDGWEPQEVDRDELIFLYQMPPQPGNLETFLDKHIDDEIKSSNS